MHISGCRQFSDIDILQGSVATYLKCGGCLIGKSVNIWESYGQEFSFLFFDSRCSLPCAGKLTSVKLSAAPNQKLKKWEKIKMKIDIFRNIGKQSRESVGSEEEKGYVEKDFWIREKLSLE